MAKKKLKKKKTSSVHFYQKNTFQFSEIEKRIYIFGGFDKS